MLVAGGKYTTYRVMAADVVDAARRPVCPACPPRAPATAAARCGRVGRTFRDRAAELAAGAGVPGGAEHLLGRYGDRIDESSTWPGADPALAPPLAGAPDYLAAEVVHAAPPRAPAPGGRADPADPDLDRDRPPGRGHRPGRRADGGVLGLGRRRTAREIEHYTARVEAERESQRMPDDRTADAARLGAPDVRAAGRVGLPQRAASPSWVVLGVPPAGGRP